MHASEHGFSVTRRARKSQGTGGEPIDVRWGCRRQPEIPPRMLLGRRARVLAKGCRAHRVDPVFHSRRPDGREPRRPVPSERLAPCHVRRARSQECGRRDAPVAHLPPPGVAERRTGDGDRRRAHDDPATMACVAERPRTRPLAQRRAVLPAEPDRRASIAIPSTALPRTCGWRAKHPSTSRRASSPPC